MVSVGVSSEPEAHPVALARARAVGLPLTDQAEMLLCYQALADPPRWELAGQWPGAPKPLFVDFTQGKVAWKVRHPGKGKHPLARALGIEHGKRPIILDGTAGLGRDAWLMASLGCTVYLCERHPVVATLLLDGLERARRQGLAAADHLIWLGDQLEDIEGVDEAPEVIYLDPMYPEPPRKRAAAVKKDMQYLRRLVGGDDDAADTLARARALAPRVVMKRPDWASPVGTPLGTVREGDHCFDIYAGS
jgi:16S rRNA (guanine1516-N2)-methyltransferase